MKQLHDLLDLHSVFTTHGYGVSTQTIIDAQERLQYTFPPSYKSFLKEFGFLIVKNRDYFGLIEGVDYLHSQLLVVNNRLRSEPDFPRNLLIIQDNEDFGMVALDANDISHDNEYYVVRWDYWSKEIYEKCASSFIEFLINDILDITN